MTGKSASNTVINTMAKVKLSNKQLLTIFQVLSKLDPGLDPQNRTKSAFTFKAKASYVLARNFKRLRGIVDDLEKIRVDTFKKYRQGEEETLSGENAKQFTAEFQEVLDETVEFDFYTIDVNDLELDKNHVNMDVLSELLDTIVIGEIT